MMMPPTPIIPISEPATRPTPAEYSSTPAPSTVIRALRAVLEGAGERADAAGSRLWTVDSLRAR